MRRLPVVLGEGKLLGVVSINDLTRACVDPKLGNGIRAAEVTATLAVIGTPREQKRRGSSADLRA